MAFAGLIDVQDRMLLNRSYTPVTSPNRARATFEIGETVGWDQAHDVLYAGRARHGCGPALALGIRKWPARLPWTMLAREEDQPDRPCRPARCSSRKPT